MMSNLLLTVTPLTWFGALLIWSAFTLVWNICLQVARILPVRLLGVKNEAIRAERPPGFAFHACPVLVALFWILEDVGVRGKFGEGRAPGGCNSQCVWYLYALTGRVGIQHVLTDDHHNTHRGAKNPLHHRGGDKEESFNGYGR